MSNNPPWSRATINSPASGEYVTNAETGMERVLHIGKVAITESKLLQLELYMEFVDRLIAEDPKAAAIMAAVKAKRRIL